MKHLLQSLFFLFTTLSFAQVGIGTVTPKATLDVVSKPLDNTVIDGIKVPSLSGDQLFTKNALYTTQQDGTIVYVTSAPSIGNQINETINVKRTGFYFFDNGNWIGLSSENNKLDDWNYLVMNWSTEPTENTTITGGTVWNYTLNGITRYRFVPDSYNSTQDAFYETFDGTTLSNQINTRG